MKGDRIRRAENVDEGLSFGSYFANSRRTYEREIWTTKSLIRMLPNDVPNSFVPSSIAFSPPLDVLTQTGMQVAKGFRHLYKNLYL